MTIGAHSNKGRGGTTELRPRASDAKDVVDRDTDPRRVDDAGTDAAKELWVALLLQNIAPRVVRLGTAESSAAGPDDSGRRPSAGKMTFGPAIIDASSSEGPSGIGEGMEGAHTSAQIGQMRLEVDGGRLGTVYLTVQRQGTAVSVVVGVADPVQRALVELELGSLIQALRAAGLNVGSVRVLHPDAAGTALAQGKKGMTLQTPESASLAYRSNRTRQQPDVEEGLDVVG